MQCLLLVHSFIATEYLQSTALKKDLLRGRHHPVPYLRLWWWSGALELLVSASLYATLRLPPTCAGRNCLGAGDFPRGECCLDCARLVSVSLPSPCFEHVRLLYFPPLIPDSLLPSSLTSLACGDCFSPEDLDRVVAGLPALAFLSTRSLGLGFPAAAPRTLRRLALKSLVHLPAAIPSVEELKISIWNLPADPDALDLARFFPNLRSLSVRSYNKQAAVRFCGLDALTRLRWLRLESLDLLGGVEHPRLFSRLDYLHLFQPGCLDLLCHFSAVSSLTLMNVTTALLDHLPCLPSVTVFAAEWPDFDETSCSHLTRLFPSLSVLAFYADHRMRQRVTKVRQLGGIPGHLSYCFYDN